MSKFVVAEQFHGPAGRVNGGYAAGLFAEQVQGPARSVLKAGIPVEVELTFRRTDDGGVEVIDPEGAVIGLSTPISADDLPTPPPPPSLEAARRAGRYVEGESTLFHTLCFNCGMDRVEGDALRVYCGQLEDAPIGHIAGPWTPNPVFADEDGLVPMAVMWAALDCAGHFAWWAKEGRTLAMLGTMAGEVLRRPRVGETCIVTAWPLEREGRKQFSGTALFTADGELLARTHEVWVALRPREG